MKIATWNVNSLTARMGRVEAWLQAQACDVVCLQELKMETERFPFAAFEALGYRAVALGQKTYNGVAILVRDHLPAPQAVQQGIPGYDDPQRRALAVSVGDLRVICLYVVNGQAVGSEKFDYKLEWLRRCSDWLRAEVAQHPRLVVTGDFNIAPTDADVHDPEAWRGQVLCTDEERAAFQGWLDLGLEDCFRRFPQPPQTFSWWDYRMLAFPKNRGLRIDHILATPALAAQCTACTVDRNERKGEKPSDHAPVIATFTM